ncbi:MAG: hypothetical protein CMH64_01835 [Nanoarchaeota archaeon]|nr:hypothetical protein [Nanoarchaeota archaeon]|tara:strand:- start:362 stop:1246 length:885 start_codon:yes stop_codon:yes gene_type:complete
MLRNLFKRNGEKNSSLLEICANEHDKAFNFNLETNEVYFVGENSVIGDITGMVDSGKNKHSEIAAEELPQDKELIDLFGRPLRMGIVKPNNIYKILYEKDLKTRAVFDRLINRNVANVIEAMVHMKPKEGVDYTPVELDLLLVNRGPYDNIRWTRALYDHGLLTLEEMEGNSRIANEVLKYINFVANFNVPVNVAVDRDDEKPGKVMGDKEFLEILHGHYNTLSEEIASYGHPLGFGDVDCIYIDGTDTVERNSKKFVGALRSKIISSVKGGKYRNEPPDGEENRPYEDQLQQA